MLVSKGRYDDMRERALRAEAQVDRLQGLLDELTLRMKVVTPRKSVNTPSEDRNDASMQDDTPPLPPPVEDAIRRRARPGSSLEDQLRQDAQQALLMGGRDFDAEHYAQHIERGTRIDGWPL